MDDVMFADTGQENRRRAGATPEYNVSVGGGWAPGMASAGVQGQSPWSGGEAPLKRKTF